MGLFELFYDRGDRIYKSIFNTFASFVFSELKQFKWTVDEGDGSLLASYNSEIIRVSLIPVDNMTNEELKENGLNMRCFIYGPSFEGKFFIE